MPMVYVLSQARCKHNVNMQINENPQPAMSMQWIMRWGHDFPKDKGVGMLTLSQFGENPCVMGRTHQNCQLCSFLSSLTNHLFFQKVVELVIASKGNSMGKFELGIAPSFGMSCFACMDKKTPEPYASFDPRVHVLDLLSCFESCGAFWLIIGLHSPFTESSSVVEIFWCVSFTFYECLVTLW